MFDPELVREIRAPGKNNYPVMRRILLQIQGVEMGAYCCYVAFFQSLTFINCRSTRIYSFFSPSTAPKIL